MLRAGLTDSTTRDRSSNAIIMEATVEVEEATQTSLLGGQCSSLSRYVMSAYTSTGAADKPREMLPISRYGLHRQRHQETTSQKMSVSDVSERRIRSTNHINQVAVVIRRRDILPRQNQNQKTMMTSIVEVKNVEAASTVIRMIEVIRRKEDDTKTRNAHLNIVTSRVLGLARGQLKEFTTIKRMNGLRRVAHVQTGAYLAQAWYHPPQVQINQVLQAARVKARKQADQIPTLTMLDRNH